MHSHPSRKLARKAITATTSIRWMVMERPVLVGPEILQKYDKVVKRFNESRAQAMPKPREE